MNRLHGLGGVLNMGIVGVMSEIKKIHTEDLVLISIGKFFYAYGKDAYILSYLFGYKLMKIEAENVYSCAFPKQSYSKVIANLENNKINYMILDRRNNYNVDEKSNNGNLNNYKKVFEKAHILINKKLRAEKIYEFLIKNIEDNNINNWLKGMEEILYGKGKV